MGRGQRKVHLRAMRLVASIVVLVALAGCGSSAIEGTLEWAQSPSLSSHSLRGQVRNTPSHPVTVDARSMRLLDDHGRKLPGQMRVAGGAGSPELAAGGGTPPPGSGKRGKTWGIGQG